MTDLERTLEQLVERVVDRLRVVIREEITLADTSRRRPALERTPAIGSVFLKRGTWFARVKDEAGTWHGISTGYGPTQKARAIRFMRERQAEYDARPRVHRAGKKGHRARTETPGVVYALRLLPAMPNRIKVGFTSSKLAVRIGQHKVTCPELEILATWAGTRADEKRAHAALAGRVGANEIFDVADADQALAAIDALLGARA